MESIPNSNTDAVPVAPEKLYPRIIVAYACEKVRIVHASIVMNLKYMEKSLQTQEAPIVWVGAWEGKIYGC